MGDKRVGWFAPQACENGRGAILLSVARGKVSEGIDFGECPQPPSPPLRSFEGDPDLPFCCLGRSQPGAEFVPCLKFTKILKLGEGRVYVQG